MQYSATPRVVPRDCLPGFICKILSNVVACAPPQTTSKCVRLTYRTSYASAAHRFDILMMNESIPMYIAIENGLMPPTTETQVLMLSSTRACSPVAAGTSSPRRLATASSLVSPAPACALADLQRESRVRRGLLQKAERRQSV
jgi:hypothetical protein